MPLNHPTGLPLTVPADASPVVPLPYREQYSLDQIEKMIQRKMAQKNKDAMWAELEHLFQRVPTMTQPQFNKHIHKLGVELSPEALTALFRKYDVDNSGKIDVYEYCAALMLGHPKEKCKAYDKQAAIAAAAAARKQKKLDGDSSSAHWADNPETVERLLREKVSKNTSKDSDLIRQAWFMLGRKKEILPDAFLKVIKNLGISCTQRVANILFQKYDDDHNGFLDVYEFVKALMPKDIVGKTWNVQSEEVRAKFDATFKRGANLPEVLPPHLKNWKMPLIELERRVLEKLEQHTSSKSKQLGLRQAFKHFSKDGSSSISRKDFMNGLRALGFVLSAEEVNVLFDKYDKNKDSMLDYREFQEGFFPHDGGPQAATQQRPLVRPPLADPTPQFIGDEFRLTGGGGAAELAKELALARHRQSPIYYNTLPTRQAGRSKRYAPPVFTPPAGHGFVETIQHHLPSAINPSPKVYNLSPPPKTATRLAPPWASLTYQRNPPKK